MQACKLCTTVQPQHAPECIFIARTHHSTPSPRLCLLLLGDLCSVHPATGCCSPPFHLWHIQKPRLSVQTAVLPPKSPMSSVTAFQIAKLPQSPAAAQEVNSCRCIPAGPCQKCERRLWLPRLPASVSGCAQAAAEQSRLVRMPEGDSCLSAPFFFLLLLPTSFSSLLVPPMLLPAGYPCNQVELKH